MFREVAGRDSMSADVGVDGCELLSKEVGTTQCYHYQGSTTVRNWARARQLVSCLRLPPSSSLLPLPARRWHFHNLNFDTNELGIPDHKLFRPPTRC